MQDPEALRLHYQDFLEPRGEPPRILLTGHSHQAWPACARDGVIESYSLAAQHVDDKWAAVFAARDEVAQHIASRIGGSPSQLAFAQNTHELVVRWLSALDLRARPRIVSTRGEFHSAYRQLQRLREEGIDLHLVDALPVHTLAQRLADALTEDTAAVMVSSVLFETSHVVPKLEELIARANSLGVSVMLDGYHAFDALEYAPSEDAFVVSGGYKYAQWGEGVCFMRVPTGCTLRPIYTGWFAGFAQLSAPRDNRETHYETDGATRFAGSTFDPASVLRARAVVRFFEREGLTVENLRARSLGQTQRIIEQAATWPGVRIATPHEAAERGGFVSLETPHADALVTALRREHIYVDSRANYLRLGPAPYVTDHELARALDTVARLVHATI
ncbi:MAG: kynureninase [Deltaproteobacteria bacterium]|nr:kynureninase [Deltaproteobacteria bacterium]